MDVDLSRAFKVIPGSAVREVQDIRSFKFQPSLGVRVINIIKAGSISGAVTDASQVPLADVTVTALRDGQEVATTSTDADGTYMLVGLSPGTYDVAFAADGYVEFQSTDVTVTAGESTNVDATLDAAAP